MAIEGFSPSPSPSPSPPPPPPYYQLLKRGSARLGRVKKEEYQDAKMILIRGVPALIKDFTDKFIE